MNTFSIIVAVDKFFGIGKDNKLPWRLQADMAWFKKVTTETTGDTLNAVIMGRKTWESIPEKFRPLPGRTNIVISRSPEKVSADHVMKDLDTALEYAYENCEKVFVIGGASIYKQAMKHPQLGELLMTYINFSYECDTFFPTLERCKEVEVIQKGTEDEINFTIKRYEPA